MKKIIALWSFYIFSLMLVSNLNAGGGNLWNLRDGETDKVIDEQNKVQFEEIE